MYIKNRRNSNKFKGFGSYQTLCLTENLMGLALGSILYNYEFEKLNPNLKIKERVNPTPSLENRFKLKLLHKREHN